MRGHHNCTISQGAPIRERINVNGVSTMTPELLVLADDLTGALEAGAAFAQRGIPTVVSWGSDYNFDVPVLVIDTETRHAAPQYASETIAGLMQRIPSPHVYKKTDSTLRGNIRAELAALSWFGLVIYVPAYPQVGRTVHNNHLHVYGVPVEQTDFANDPLYPVSDGDLSRLLTGVDNVTICGANSEDAIDRIAQKWLRNGGNAAGPTGMLHSAARILAITPQAPLFPKAARLLVVLGSRSECSRQQIVAASHLFSSSQWELMQNVSQLQDAPLSYAANFGVEAAQRLATGNFDGCLVIGGDTAYATLRALGCSSLEPIGEIIPGIPVSVLPNGLTLITKAGGFGSPQTLLDLHRLLTHV